MVWGVRERRTDLMEEHVQRVEAVRQACIAATLQAYEDAGISGLCHEGRWEYAVDAMWRLQLRPLVQALLLAAEHEDAAQVAALARFRSGRPQIPRCGLLATDDSYDGLEAGSLHIKTLHVPEKSGTFNP